MLYPLFKYILKGLVIIMIQAYSQNITVTTPADVPFNNVTKFKGQTVVHEAPSSFNFNKCGVYHVHVDGSASGAGEVTFQLYKNDVPLNEAQTTITLTADALQNFAFETLITVSENNTCCCCTSPTIVQLSVTSDGDAPVEVTLDHVNAVITKLC